MTTESICEFGKLVQSLKIMDMDRDNAGLYQLGIADGHTDFRDWILQQIGRKLTMRGRIGEEGEPFDLSEEDKRAIDTHWSRGEKADENGKIPVWVHTDGKKYGQYPRFDFEAGIQYVVFVPNAP